MAAVGSHRQMTKRRLSANYAPQMPLLPPAPGLTIIALLAAATASLAADRTAPGPRTNPPAPARMDEALVDLARTCPGVIIDLRYATARNLTGRAIYSPGARALLRLSVAERLNRAQQLLQSKGFGLKVWDAYRPPWAQHVLWNAVRNPAYVVQPSETGSLHGWGAAVDVTLVDLRGREVRMPTDFDAFSEAARYDYAGKDAEVASNLKTLQSAMAQAGFRHIRDEWWHYSARTLGFGGPIDTPLSGPPPEELANAESAAAASEDDSAASSKATPRKKQRTQSRALFPKRPEENL